MKDVVGLTPQALEWRARYQTAIDVLVRLRATFPECFSQLNAGLKKPIKIGIHNDIAAQLPDVDPDAIGLALRVYTLHESYWRAIVKGAPRIDLDGKPAGAVTADEAAHAQRRLTNKPNRPKAASAPAPAVKQPPAAKAKPQQLQIKRASLADLREAARKRKGNDRVAS